jgi:hexosaminidase
MRVSMVRIRLNRLALFVLAVGVLGSGQLLAQQPELIPQPRELRTEAAPFRVGAGLEIALLSPASPKDSYAAANLQKELWRDTGLIFPIVTTVGAPSGKPAILLGRLNQPDMASLLKEQGLSPDGIAAQGYALSVTPERVLVAGKDAAGLFYGVQTLRQLIVPTGNGEAQVLGAQIRDWPALEYRGTQVDLARGPVPKLAYLKRIVRTIAAFKMNQLYLYMEDSFRVKGQPLIGVLSDTLTQQDWRSLVAYAGRYHVDLVPATEDCGHLHQILRFEQYSGMAERPHGFMLAPGDPRDMGFLKSIYAQLLPIFPSKFYHIGCDETFELGLGRSKQMVEQQGYGKVYVDYLTRVYNLVRTYNKQVMFWGDIAVEHPEMISSLPKGLIVASWVYGPQKSYERWLKPFAGTGMKIFVCPWTGNTSLIVPDYEEAAYNIRQFIADGKKAGAIGTDVTVWNDDGESLYGPNWWSIVYGAACAWEPGNPTTEDFNRKFDWAFFRDPGPSLVNALMDLGHLNEVIRAGGPVQTYDMKRGGADDAKFWHDPFSPLWQPEVEKTLPIASLLRMTAEDAYTTMVNDRHLARRNADVLKDLEFGALKMDALGMRYQYVQEISDRYDDAYAHQNDRTWRQTGSDLSDIDSTNGRLQDLRDYTTRLQEIYKQLWLSENLPTWLPNMLQLYERNGRLWQRLIAKYSDLRTAHYQGQPLPSPESLGLLPASPASGSTPPNP